MRRLALTLVVLAPGMFVACGGGDNTTSSSSASSSSSSTSTTTSSTSSSSGAKACTIPNDCYDKDMCTTDECTDGTCSNAPIKVDDSIACTKDTCDPVTGTIAHTTDDALCKMGEHCDAVVGCTKKLLNGVISELVPLETVTDKELVEIYNPNSVDAELTGFALENGDGSTAAIHAASDPTGAAKTPIVVPAKGFAYGVANPPIAQLIPNDATFVYGDPATSWSMADTGDLVKLVDDKAKTIDAVDFTKLVTDPAVEIKAGDFPAVKGRSIQLDPKSLEAKANDDGSAWCVSYRGKNSAGKANEACDGYVLNEVLAAYAFPQANPGSNQNTFIEIAGPAGGPLLAYSVVGFSGASKKTTVRIGTGGLKSVLRMPMKNLFVIADGDVDNGTTNVPNADLVAGNAVPVGGGMMGQTLQILDANNQVIDALGFGASAMAEGNPIAEVIPDTIAISMARDALATDTNDNATDFHYDPTPTPGEPNLPVAPALVGFDPFSPTDGLAIATTTVTLVAHDFADFKTVGGVAPMSNDVTGTFSGNAILDTSANNDGCTIIDAKNGGRGDVTVRCTVPANAGLAARGDVTLTNPTALGGAATLPMAWTYTTVNNLLPMGQPDLCVLEMPAMSTTQQGMTSAAFLGQVTKLGVTDVAGADPSVLAQLGYGKSNADPTKTSGFVFATGTWTQQLANADEYSATFVAPPVIASTSYGVVFRVSFDGGLSFTYCDTAGEGSSVATKLNVAKLGTFVSTP